MALLLHDNRLRLSHNQVCFQVERSGELVDKQVNVQKESLKKTSGIHAKFPQAHKKVCDENERNKQRKKNNGSLKYF